MGKTTLLATLRQELSAAAGQISAILNPLLSPTEFLEMTSVEVQEYIQHRWERAGGKERHPFEPNALSGIADISGGIPRLINSICDTSLILAFADAKRRVGLQHVMDASRDLRLHTGANAKALPLAPRQADEHVPGSAACPAASISSAMPFVQPQAPVVLTPRTLKRQQAAG